MLGLLGLVSVVGGGCIACVATGRSHERHLDVLSGLLVVAGLSLIGAMLPVGH